MVGFNIFYVGFKITVSSFSVTLTRFVCAVISHIQLKKEQRQGLLMIKYALHHPKEFKNEYSAYGIGLM